ncbi:hypothetical protein PGT21_004122 [Puccinia graminis f. sp. tritici]|uniref:Uncharacterized protein n=1 Tax=Puccinia graminis f. sp. tritici TaxID=56615 RepID=A0A5B0MKL7_PUCGR|nr:hypothetical protein PGT21_004122 [Puccinia graminis f. sp. tritici]KAA1135589.1 hypothetical protein PGTUg99_024025 [Puccinia graminis f. sp. tritici]
MNISKSLMMVTMFSVFICVKAPTTVQGYDVWTIDGDEWRPYGEVERFNQQDMQRFGGSIHYSPTSSFTNIPDWGVTITRSSNPHMAFITNQGNVHLEYLLENATGDRYLKRAIPIRTQHLVPASSFRVLCIRRWRA